MANIALTSRCNLKCEYCFAHELVENKGEDITLGTFMEILDFLNGEGQIGLIGGEPLLHKDFNEILSILNRAYFVNQVMVFTNGIYLDRVEKSLLTNKVSFLVNVNSREQIGDGNFEKLRENVRNLLNYIPKSHVTVGINIYKENQNFCDPVSIIKEFGFKRVRVSVVIPKNKDEGAFKYFDKMKGTLLDLCRTLKKLGVSPAYDCNAIPACVYTKKELSLLDSLTYENELERRIFMGEASVCSPIVDIYPDKTATRCFGMSDYKVKIDDFENINDLKNHFFMEIDTRLVHKITKSECEKCYKQKVFGCFGGCLAYKK